MDYNLYDEVCKNCITNIWGLSKDNKEIRLINFNPKNEKHICVLYLADITHTIFNFPLKIKIGKIKGFLLKRKHKNFIAVPGLNEEDSVDVDEMIKFMEDRIKHPNIFQEIYEEYYKKKA